jgi:NTP pyrophosphatase (non-canonical NTP hydrolase)
MQTTDKTPRDFLMSNVNAFSGDLLITDTYVPELYPDHLDKLARNKRVFSFCPEMIHADKLGFKLCTTLRLKRVTSVTTLTKDGSPHGLQIPLMVQEAAEDVNFEKTKIKYFVVEKGNLFEVSDASVRMARHLSEIEQVKNFGELIKVVKRLRGEGGCPNDRAEVEESVAEHFVEESDEVKEAVRSKKLEDIKEEIGNVLYNIFLFAEIKGEKGEFAIKDIVDSAIRKMTEKHPDVFNDEKK